MANIWRRFVSLFSKSNKEIPIEEPMEEPSLVPADEWGTKEDGLLEEVEADPVLIAVPEMPYWLIDEESLRDEGVLFGLSASEPSTKTDIIYKYFAQLLAPFERQIEEVNEHVQELNLFIEQRQNRIEELKQKLETINTSTVTENTPHLLRSVVGLVLAIIMCVGNYSLIEQSIAYSLPNSEWLALGIFSAGMFNLFNAVSIFHQERIKVGFWRLVEEVGMPLVASLFVIAQVWEHQSWWQVAALFGFVLFLFLFAGKLFLGMLTVFRKDMATWQANRQQVKKARIDKHAYEQELTKLSLEIDEIRTQKWQYLKEQGVAEEEKSRLIGKRDMLIKLFESEFNLARQVKMLGVVTDINQL